MSEELKPCPFCQRQLKQRGGPNPSATCETVGCWLAERRIAIVTDDHTQVAAWNRRASPAPAATSGVGEVEPFMYAYQCVDDGHWQAYRNQLKRADGSICPGKPLYPSPPSPDIDRLTRELSMAVEALKAAKTYMETPTTDDEDVRAYLAVTEALKTIRGE